MFLDTADDATTLPSSPARGTTHGDAPSPGQDRDWIPLPGGGRLDLRRDRWDGVLTPEEVAACRQHGVPLAYDCAQTGWVPLSVEDEDAPVMVQRATPAASAAAATVAGDPADEWWSRLRASLDAPLEDARGDRGTSVATEAVRRAVQREVTEVYSTDGLREAERVHWLLRSVAARRLPDLRISRPAAAPDAALGFRRWTQDDAPVFTSLLGNARVWEYLPEPFPEPFDEDTARTLIELGALDFHHRAVAVEWRGKPVGQCLLRFDTHADVRTAEVAYWLGEEHWGQGLMGRILPVFTRESFREHDLDVIYAWIREDHGASERVARRAGYTRDDFPYEAELAASMGRPGFVRYAAFRQAVLAEDPVGDESATAPRAHAG